MKMRVMFQIWFEFELPVDKMTIYWLKMKSHSEFFA